MRSTGGGSDICLLVVEAMKMLEPIKATIDGIVTVLETVAGRCFFVVSTDPRCGSRVGQRPSHSIY